MIFDTLFISTVLPLGCKQYNTIGCIHTTMLECKELRHKNVDFNFPRNKTFFLNNKYNFYYDIDLKNQFGVIYGAKIFRMFIQKVNKSAAKTIMSSDYLLNTVQCTIN